MAAAKTGSYLAPAPNGIVAYRNVGAGTSTPRAIFLPMEILAESVEVSSEIPGPASGALGDIIKRGWRFRFRGKK